MSNCKYQTFNKNILSWQFRVDIFVIECTDPDVYWEIFLLRYFAGLLRNTLQMRMFQNNYWLFSQMIWNLNNLRHPSILWLYKFAVVYRVRRCRSRDGIRPPFSAQASLTPSHCPWPCCSDWPAPTNTLKANNALQASGWAIKVFFSFLAKCGAFVNSHYTASS